MYQSIGNITAKPVTSGGAGPVPTMDAAGIASGMAFLVSELEKRDTLVREPLTSITYPRDLPIRVGGGWVDYVSAMNVSYGVTGGSLDGPVAAGGQNGIALVQASMDKGVYKAHAFSVGMRILWVDMQKANFIGRSLDQLLHEGVRLTYDKHADANAYVGLSTYGTAGLVNHPDVTETTVANGAASATQGAKKTPAEILKDVNDAITQVWAAAEYDTGAMPNHILLPYAQYTHILNTMVTDLATETVLDYILKNNVASKNGGSLYVGATSWCKGAGTASADRMVVYVNDERFLAMDELAPLTRALTQPNAAEGCYDTAYFANLSEVQLFYPQTVGYFDGI